MKNVLIYWNLNRDCVSIKANGHVIGYAKSVIIENVTFKVQESGRQRAIRDGQRNVHAYACGDLVAADWIENKESLAVSWNGIDSDAAKLHTRRIKYNPFRGPNFTIDGAAVASVQSMYLTGNKQVKAQAFAP